MGLLKRTYERVLRWSAHPKAPWYLGWVSFVDASVFPISPLVMLVPMTIAVPERAMRYVMIATFASAVGGLIGYGLGLFGLERLVLPFLNQLGWSVEQHYALALDWFSQHGFWTLFLAGFTPFPYKFFTIAAGALKFKLSWFMLASVLGRGLRFLAVAAVLLWGGPLVKRALVSYGRHLSWMLLGMGIVIGWLWLAH